MMEPFGRGLGRRELLRYAGSMDQIAGIREVVHQDGRMRGMRALQVWSGPLGFELLPDMCMDIRRLSYRGIDLSWQAKTGYCANALAAPVLGEFDRYFGGGMLWTCGLKNAGDDYVDADGRFQHAHGRLGILPCDQVWYRQGWEGEDYRLTAGGCVREGALGGYNLTFTREISTSLRRPEIKITDTLENWEPQETDYLILYHFNFGFPFLTPDLRLRFPEERAKILPRTAEAEAGMAAFDRIGEPEDGLAEQVFFHHPKPEADGTACVELENPALGIGAYLRYRTEHLPILTHWKSMRSGEYALGIEPGNSYIGGMEAERKGGHVGRIEGFGRRRFELTLGVRDL